MADERTTWEEFEPSDLERACIHAGNLSSEVGDIDLLRPCDDDREALYDAEYHARKAYNILYKLARKARREWGEQVAEEEASQAADEILRASGDLK